MNLKFKKLKIVTILLDALFHGGLRDIFMFHVLAINLLILHISFRDENGAFTSFLHRVTNLLSYKLI